MYLLERVFYSTRRTLGTYALASSQNHPTVRKAMEHASVNSMLLYQHQGIESIRVVIELRNEGVVTRRLLSCWVDWWTR